MPWLDIPGRGCVQACLDQVPDQILRNNFVSVFSDASSRQDCFLGIHFFYLWLVI